jgi:nucleoside-diphosphate-sugar epimerase
MDKLQLEQVRQVLVLGGSGAIGSALIQELLQRSPQLLIHTLSRRPLAFSDPRVNAILTPLLAKSLKGKLSTAFGFVAISAMVGSIGENELGAGTATAPPKRRSICF